MHRLIEDYGITHFGTSAKYLSILEQKSVDPKAAGLALQGKAAAVVTNPIQKQTLYAAGFTNEGHTDYLADLARRGGFKAEPVMMLATGSLRTVPVTVHVPLAEVPARLNRDLIEFLA